MLHPFQSRHPVPDRFPSPFGAPHPLAWDAALALQARLPALAEGKMLGVLVVRTPAGGLGALHGVSGKQDDWRVPGFVGPVFDEAAQDRFWPAGQADLGARSARIAALDAALATADSRLADLAARRTDALGALKARLAARKSDRRRRRAAGEDVHALAQESRGDTAALRELKAAFATEGAPLQADRARIAARRQTEARARSERSRALQRALHDTYRFGSSVGETIGIIDLFAPHAPPAGAGECAAPKLLAHAHAHGLHPIALAEFWWGPQPPGGGRWHGQPYPACRGKCGIILPFQLRGLAVEPPPVFEDPAPPAPRLIYEDASLIAVDKPSGLLSAPGRYRQETVMSRMGRADLRPVHRLDLDTSGVLLLAKREAICIAMQKRFARRVVQKRYVALLDGPVPGEAGRIDLALRPDVHDRPRQMHAPSGKAAVTRWARIGPSRVALWPETGRTHQLRVHCAHPKGLGVPIRGDRLYGRAGERLLLHAERLAFEHPDDGRWVEIEAPVPF